SEHGMDAVQIAPVAERACIAAGTVYRYFPSKTALVEALVEAVADSEIAAMRDAAEAAPGPLSGLAAAIVTLSARARRQKRLIWALTTEPVAPEVDAVRANFRCALAKELESRLKSQDAADIPAALAAPALLGALLEGLIGPLAAADTNGVATGASAAPDDRERVQMVALLALRGVGIMDARARGLVIQAPWPAGDPGAAA
ncbi:MAG: helix-turn-helix transcriptional regulator, partial [Rhizobiales bacterium]|nr:helix-turn-helix transcriptional regulator [Hyphomicrobiales bacterium]